MAILPTAFLAIFYTAFVYLIPLIVLIVNGHIGQVDIEAFSQCYYVSALGWMAILFLKKFVNYVQTCLELTKYQQNRNNILIGLGFIALSSIVGRVVFYDIAKIEKFRSIIYLYLLATSFGSFYLIFVEEAAKKCKWNFKFSKDQLEGVCSAVVLNIIAVLLPCITAVGNNHQNSIIFLQIALGLVGTTSLIEILMILMGKLELDGQSDGEELTSVTIGKPKEAFRNDRVYVM